MNTHPACSGELPFDANVIVSIAKQPLCQSFIPQTDMGDAIYEWMDSQVEKLSTAHLTEILRLSEYRSFVDSCFMKAAKQELLSRGYYDLSLGWEISLSWQVSLNWRRVGRWSLTY